MRGEQRLQVPAEGGEVGRILGHTGIDRAGHGFDADRDQRVLGGIEGLRHPGRADEAPVEPVGPLVVGAHEQRPPARPFGAELRAAVAAGIVEAPQRAVAVPHHDDRRRADAGRQIGARSGDLAFEADHDPRAAEDGVEVEAEDVGVRVEGLRQRVAGTAGVEQGADAMDVVHGGLRRMPEGARIGPGPIQQNIDAAIE